MKNIWIFVCVLTLSACANALFPELDNDIQSIPSDKQNASYEEDASVEAHPIKPVFMGKSEAKTEEKNIHVVEDSFEPKVEVQQEEQEEATFMSSGPSVEVLQDTFYFRNGSKSLEDANSQIKSIAKFVKEHNAKVKVLGYASSRTKNTDPVSHKMANFKISLERAQSVAKELERAGIKKENIVIEALSDTKPAYKEVMPEGERLNRRVEVYVLY